MMISSFRRSLQKDDAGQAIIIGAVMMLVIAVAIMTTAQLGWAIKSRIQLQHAADNAAYTNATMVARSMNFIAWTNRAMVSQYVSAMAFQSMVTHLDGLNMLIAAAAASVLSAAFILGVVGRILEAIIFTAAIGAAMVALAKVLGKAGEGIEKAADAVQKVINGLDVVIGPIVQVIGYLNEYVNYYLMQQLLGKGYLLANFVNSAFGGTGFYRESLTGTIGSDQVNGSDSPDVYNIISQAINGVGLLELFDSNSAKVGKDNANDEAIKAETLMTMIVNASREGRGKVTFESKREFKLSTVFTAIVSLLGGGSLEGLQKVLDLFDNMFPQSLGGTLIANVTATSASSYDETKKIGTSKENDAKIKDNNPVFDMNQYWNIGKKLKGRALISDQVTRPPLGSFGGLIGRALNFFAAGGELIPVEKRVGIQATAKVGTNVHCRYGGLVAFEIPGNSLGEQCDGICEKTQDSCNENCEQYCPGGNYIKDEEGNPTDECASSMAWRSKPSAPTGDDAVDCGQCGSADVGEDGDCPAAKQCREALSQTMDQIEDAANDAAGDVMEGLFGGRMAQVSVSCNEGNGDEASRHKFSGITPYVSFNIKRYHSLQSKHAEQLYPTFLAAAHWKPTFMKYGALGFGEQGSRFRFSTTLRKSTAHERLGRIYDSDIGRKGRIMEGLKNKHGSDAYNFNYVAGGDSGVEFLGSAGFHAWSASQVYYHRPGTWAEPPNLFNPFWKAKLSPAVGVLNNLPAGIGGLSGGLSKLLTLVMVH